MTFENIRNLREDADKTQTEIAEYLNIKQTTYSKYELGKINVPIEMLIKIADYYDVSLDYLVGRKRKYKKQKGTVARLQWFFFYRVSPFGEPFIHLSWEIVAIW